jgi:hypothetical protein
MDMEARMQRMEQVVLGIGTENGLLREVKAMRAEMADGFDRMESVLNQERAERIAGDRDEAKARDAQWSGLYFRIAASIFGLIGLGGISVLVAVLTK